MSVNPSPSCCFNQGVTFNMLALELSIGGQAHFYLLVYPATQGSTSKAKTSAVKSQIWYQWRLLSGLLSALYASSRPTNYLGELLEATDSNNARNTGHDEFVSWIDK